MIKTKSKSVPVKKRRKKRNLNEKNILKSLERPHKTNSNHIFYLTFYILIKLIISNKCYKFTYYYNPTKDLFFIHPV